MSSGEIKKLQNSRVIEQYEIIGTCPCFKLIDGEATCINGDTIEEIEAIAVHPSLILFSEESFADETTNGLPMCYGCVQINQGNDHVLCISKGKPIRIRNRFLTGEDLKQALDAFPRDQHADHQDVCTTCLYKVLIGSYEKVDTN